MIYGIKGMFGWEGLGVYYENQNHSVCLKLYYYNFDSPKIKNFLTSTF